MLGESMAIHVMVVPRCDNEMMKCESVKFITFNNN